MGLGSTMTTSENPAAFEEVISHINNLVNTYPKHVIVVLGDYNADMARGTNRYADMLRPAMTRLSFRHASPTKKGQYTWRRSQDRNSERTLIDFVMIRAPPDITARDMAVSWQNWIGKATMKTLCLAKLLMERWTTSSAK